MAAFCQEVVGLPSWSTMAVSPRSTWTDSGVLLVITKSAEARALFDPEPRFPAFAVADLDAAVAPLTAHQVPLPWGIERHGPSRWVEFRDPAATCLGSRTLIFER